MNKFTEIPMRTWNWLGVNEVSTDVNAEIKEITIKANESEKLNIVNLSSNDSAQKIHVKVEDNAQIELIVLDISEGDVFREIVIELVGADSKAELAAAYFGNEDHKLDFNYIIRQRGKGSEATMDIKGALSGNCDKIFRGTLDFVRGAKGSIGREKEEVIVLSDTVRNRSVPLMLSAEDEVDGHHAVSVGRMDEDKLFYLMSRGLDKTEAERLMVMAAFNPILQRLDEPDLIDKISEIISVKTGS